MTEQLWYFGSAALETDTSPPNPLTGGRPSLSPEAVGSAWERPFTKSLSLKCPCSTCSMLDTCLWEVSRGTLTTQEAQGPPIWQGVGWEAWLGPGSTWQGPVSADPGPLTPQRPRLALSLPSLPHTQTYS